LRAELNHGSVYILTSAGTPVAVSRALREWSAIRKNIHIWGIDAPEASPYDALLEYADQFVVSGDRVDVQMDVAAKGRPLAIFELPINRTVALSLVTRSWLRTQARSSKRMSGMFEHLDRTTRIGPIRDARQIHRSMFELRIASRFPSESLRAPSRALPD